MISKGKVERAIASSSNWEHSIHLIPIVLNGDIQRFFYAIHYLERVEHEGNVIETQWHASGYIFLKPLSFFAGHI